MKHEDVVAQFLEWARGGENTRLLALVREYPFVSNTNTADGRACFIRALSQGNAAVVKAMMDKGAEVDPVRPYEFSGEVIGGALHVCVRQANPDTLQAVLEQTAQPYDLERLASGNTPLNSAVTAMIAQPFKGGNWSDNAAECVRKLLDAGASVRNAGNLIMTFAMSDLEEYTVPSDVVLRVAEQTDVIEMKVKSGNSLFPTGTTPFLSSMVRRTPQMLQDLIESGADACARNEAGQDAFALAPVKDWQKERYVANKIWLEAYRDEQVRHVRQLMESGPDILEKAFFSDTKESKALLLSTLSLNIVSLVLEPEYWAEHGGYERGIAFARGMRERTPENRSKLLSRIDDAPLQRESPLPRDESVLVGHIHNLPVRGKGAV